MRTVNALTTPLALLDQAFRAEGFLRNSGWFESYRQRRPVAFGKPLPFYTYGAIVYARKSPDPSPRWFGFHEIFHACTLAAFAVHYIAVSFAVYGN